MFSGLDVGTKKKKKGELGAVSGRVEGATAFPGASSAGGKKL